MNITAFSSHGSIEFDSESGLVISQDLDNCEDCPNVGTFDVEEYKQNYQVDHLPSNLDILDLGYWMEDESYEPAAQDWREDVNKLRSGRPLDEWVKSDSVDDPK